MADNLSRDVLLRIRAQNLATADFNAARTAVDTLTASLDKQIQAANRAEISEKELSATLTKLQQATQNFTGVATMIDQFKSFDKVLADQAARVTKARETLEQYRQKLEQNKDTSAGAEKQLERLAATFEKQQAKLRENTQTFQEMGAALQKAGVDTNALVEAENRLRQAADQAGAAITKISDAKLNLAENTRKAKEEATKLAAAEKAAAEEAKKTAAAHAAAVREQEAEQLKAFQAFTTQEKAVAEGRAKALRDVQVGVAGYRQEQQQRQQAAREAVEKQLAEERRLTEQTKEQQAQRLRDADRAARDQFEKFRQSILQRNQAQTAPPANQPQPGTAPPGAPRTDALGRPGRGASGQIGFLGLRPYELTNLGYQINDVVTGLASGQHAMQIFAQQGGQFFQIFGLAALRYLPAVAAALAAVTVAVGALQSSMREASSNHEFEGFLTANVRAMDTTAKQLTELRHQIRDLAVSWDDAGKVIRQAVSANVRPELRLPFAELAKNISRVDQVDIKDAMADIVKGFTGGREALEDFIAKYPAITEAQRKHIEQLITENKMGQAQIETFRLVAEVYRKAGAETITPLTKATEELTKSWQHLLDTIGNSKVFQDILGIFTDMVRDLKDAIEWIDKLSKAVSNKDFVTVVKMVAILAGKALDPNIGAAIERGLEPPKAPEGQTAPIPIIPPSTVGVRPEGIKGSNVENENLVYDYFKKRGYNPASIAAIMGSVGIESKFDPTATSPGGTYFGLAQWDASRRANFGASKDINVQLAYLEKEIMQRIPDFKQFAGTPSQASDVFTSKVEQAAKYTYGPRRVAAEYYAGQFPEGTQTGPTARANINADRIIREGETDAKIRRARNEAAEEAAIAQREREKARDTGADKERQDTIVQQKLDEFREQRRKINFEHEQQDNKDRIADRQNATRIEEAGQKAVEEAIGRGITNYKELYDIRKKGEAEQRQQVQNEIKESDELRNLKKSINALERENLLKDSTELDKQLQAVRTKYEALYADIKKMRERDVTIAPGELDKLEKQLQDAQKVAERQATVKSYDEEAKKALATRNELIQTYSNQQARGDITISEQQKLTKEAYDLTGASIKKAADEMEAYLKTAEGLAQPPLEIAKQTARIKELRSEIKYIDPFMKGLRDTISTSLGTGLTTAFNTVGEAIGGVIAKTKTWKDVLTAVRQAGINLFTQLLKDIANYIIKAEAAKLASSLFGVTTAGDAATGAAGSGVFGFLGKILGIGSSGAAGAGGAAVAAETTSAGSAAATAGFLFHRGGVVGRSTVPAMSVPAYWFAHAPRYHRGSVIGMGPNEQAAILQHGEEVLTRDDPRNILNRARGVGGSRDVNIRSILVADPSYVPTAMAGAQGEKIVVQHLVKNAATVRQLLKN